MSDHSNELAAEIRRRIPNVRGNQIAADVERIASEREECETLSTQRAAELRQRVRQVGRVRDLLDIADTYGADEFGAFKRDLRAAMDGEA